MPEMQRHFFKMGINSVVRPKKRPQCLINTHHQVEGPDGSIPGARVQQPVVDLHGIHRLLVALKRPLSGNVVLTRVRGHIWKTDTHTQNHTLIHSCYSFTNRLSVICPFPSSLYLLSLLFFNTINQCLTGGFCFLSKRWLDLSEKK